MENAVIWTDVMVDVETTGTDPARTNMMQLAALKFNYDTGDIGPVFNRCLAPAPFRGWDEGARDFWNKPDLRPIYHSIIGRMEDPRQVMEDFHYWAQENSSRDIRFWAKPITFDWNFVADYCRQFDLPMPFQYRMARDLNTYISARAGGVEPTAMLDWITAPGNEHDALHDCVVQTKRLFAAKNNEWGEVLV